VADVLSSTRPFIFKPFSEPLMPPPAGGVPLQYKLIVAVTNALMIFKRFGEECLPATRACEAGGRMPRILFRMF